MRLSSRLIPNEPTYDEVPVDIYDELEDIDNAPIFDEDGDLIYYPYDEVAELDGFDEYDFDPYGDT